MKIAVSGAGGFIGSEIVRSLKGDGYNVFVLSRKVCGYEGAISSIHYDPQNATVDLARLEGMDVVINLAGENIADGRWTKEKKARILNSRVKSTQAIARACAALRQPPKLLISASAVGYYGVSTRDEVFDEGSPKGKGFLAEVCEAWEVATKEARQKGIRVVHLRLASVLHPGGGVLARMVPAFRLGFGARVGTGLQPFSWVALEDVLLIIRFIMGQERLSGPVNCVAPQLITNADLNRVLSMALRKSPKFSIPSWAVGLMMGEMGRDLLLTGAKVAPARLLSQGYVFRYSNLESAMAHMFR